jgi:hypothetical protein
MDLTKIGREDVGCLQLAQDRDQWRDHMNKVMNFRVPSKAGNFLTS